MATFSEVWGSATDIAITMAGVLDNEGRASAGVTAADGSRVAISYRIETAGTPGVESNLLFFLCRYDGGTPEISDGGVPPGDADITAGTCDDLERSKAPDHIQVVDVAAIWEGFFIVDSPGPRFFVAVINRTGATLSADDVETELRYSDINLTDA